MNSSDRGLALPTRILFADDERSVRDAVARTLRGRGMIVDLAIDGAEALTLAREFPYAVVATDYRMPGISGLELVQSLQKIRPDATFVIITGALEAVEGLGQLTQVHSVIPKPWTENGLVAAIEAGVRDAQKRQAKRSGSSAAFAAVGGQYVLLVEDNDLDALMLGRSIELVAPGEFRLVRARSLAEARRFLQCREYSAVLADLGLPDASGLDTLSGILGVAPDTPILVITGADDKTLATQAVRAGAQDYLLKGNYEPDAVLRSMRYAVERKRIELRLSELAHYDPLTGLANRALMAEREKRAIPRAARSGRSVALLAVDLDHFKVINDTHGHDVGDGVLVEVARRLSASIRSEDTVARIGGDEFVILLEDLEDADGARRVAQRIHNAFATPMLIEGKELTTSPSVGIALFPDDAGNLGELQRHADAALYEAKQSGRNSYRFFSRELQNRARQRLELERDLAGALAAGQFHLVYLPDVDVRSGIVRGYQALLRWNRGPGEPLLAREFLHVLDESAEIVRVGQWVIERVCADVTLASLAVGMRLSISVSERLLASTDFVATVEGALRSHGIEGERIEIELTELSLSAHFAEVRSKLTHLASLGVSVAVDGYGAGRSSILELADLPIRTLKLDESFLIEIEGGRRQAALSATLRVAAALGWSVVATGVDTRSQLDIVQSLGCPRAQGRYWGDTVRSPGFSRRAEATPAATKAST
ncbi:MAG TPA: EAL domain-containing protein [Polyangiaceae bacterium]|nr:EAL domain-containing protein [Polyangiaceae bacterium]